MRTVVINTSAMEKDMRFDILFRIPFGEERLLWLNEDLPNLGGCVKTITERILKTPHFVDKDLNLIVIVDKYAFPYRRYRDFNEVYDRLLLTYVRSVLVEPLEKENLSPREYCLFTVEYRSEDEMPINLLRPTFRNADEEQEYAERSAVQTEEDAPQPQEDGAHRLKPRRSLPGKQKNGRPNGSGSEDSYQDQILCKLFCWKRDGKPQDIAWKIVIDEPKNVQIDLEPAFYDLAKSARDMDEDRDAFRALFPLLEERLQKVYDVDENEKKRTFLFSVTCDSENERDITMAYFQALVRVYHCIEEGRLGIECPALTEEEIRQMLQEAYAKYDFYAREENIPVRFEVLDGPNDDAVIENFAKLEIKIPADTTFSDPLIRAVFSSSPGTPPSVDSKESGSLDDKFLECAKKLYAGHDRESIEAQNTEVLMLCMGQYLEWRDEKSVDDMRFALENENKDRRLSLEYKQPGMGEVVGRYEKLEQKYAALHKKDVENIVTVENDPLDYEDVCHKTSVLCAKYEHLCKKGRLYKLAAIGGAVCVLLLFSGYMIYCGVTGWQGLARLPLYLGTLAAFAFAYLTSVSLYIRKVRIKKLKCYEELKVLKKDSETRRLNSLIRLKDYYETVMTNAETHSLWWMVILEKYRRDLVLGGLRNEHVKLFDDLRKATAGFATKLKIDIVDKKNSGKKEGYKAKLPDFDVEKSYFEEPNVKYYSFFEPDPDHNTQPKGTEGHDA